MPRRKTDFEGIQKEKSQAPKLRKSSDKSVSQPGCSHSNTIYDAQCPAAKDNSMTRAAAAARNLDASIAMRSAPHDGKPACIYAHGSSGGNMHAAIALQSATADCKRPCNCAHIKHRTLQKHPVGTNHFKTSVAAPAAHTSSPLLPAAATLRGKTQCFALRHPPQHQPHATFMQPLQCQLKLHVEWCLNHHFPKSSLPCNGD